MLNGEDYDTLALLENRSIANYRHLLDGIDLLAIDEAQNIPQIGSILKLIVDEIPAQGGLSVAGGCRCLTKDGNTSIEKEGYIPYPLQA